MKLSEIKDYGLRILIFLLLGTNICYAIRSFVPLENQAFSYWVGGFLFGAACEKFLIAKD